MSSVDSMTSEWDVLVCVFAVFSHTVQLLGVIGSIHIEPSVVLIIPDNQCLNIEPLARLELATYALRMRCSTN